VFLRALAKEKAKVKVQVERLVSRLLEVFRPPGLLGKLRERQPYFARQQLQFYHFFRLRRFGH
jgi:hypothetical protein